MTVTTSYPGVYIQELPSLVHSITPAPTSVAVFVGYTHPFRTSAVPDGDPAVQLRRLPDELRRLLLQPVAARLRRPGGLPVLPQRRPDLLRRGPAGHRSTTPTAGRRRELTPHGPVAAGERHRRRHHLHRPAAGRRAAARRDRHGGIPMQVAISNVQQTSQPDDTADIVISYGTHGRDLPQGPDRRSRDRAAGLEPGDRHAVRARRRRRSRRPARRSRSATPPRRAAAGRDGHQPGRLRAGVRGLRVARQGAGLQPAGHARDHRPGRHLGGRRLLRAQAGLLHHGHPVAADGRLGRQHRRRRPQPGRRRCRRPPRSASTPRSTTRG